MATSAKQKHRPSRQARPPQGARQSVLFLKGRRILSCSALRMTHNLVIANTYGVWLCFRLPVIAVRVSGGHLCEAEAPTEPAGETAARCAAIRFSFKGEADSFVLITLAVPKSCFRLEREQLLTATLPFARFFLHRSESNVTQNDTPFSCHECRGCVQ